MRHIERPCSNAGAISKMMRWRQNHEEAPEMPGPRETELRKQEFNPDRLEHQGRANNDAASSKRQKQELGKVEKPPRSTRAARPGGGRSGSASNASRRTQGNQGGGND